MTASSALHFAAALERPERAQAHRLEAVLRAVRGSTRAALLGGLERVRGAREFQSAVPLATADDLAAHVTAIRAGVANVLTREPVLRLERTGGSSGASKDVPWTRGLEKEFHAALLPWIHDIAVHRPQALAGPTYLSISPITAPIKAGAVPVGVEDDAAYLPHALRRRFAPLLPVPASVARLPDVATCRYVTLRCLLEAERLSFVSVWNPSFLTLMIEALDENTDRLLDDLEAGKCRPPLAVGAAEAAETVAGVVDGLTLRAWPERARALRRVLRAEGRLAPEQVWPGLALISLWTDAHAASALPGVRARFPGVELQGKGLLATEAVVTLARFDAPAPVVAVNSHFYEFLDPEAPAATPRLVGELETGRTYEVVVSTSGGLLRYRLGDLVRVEGFLSRTPCLRFMGRADAVSDLVGEKLAAVRVSEVLERALQSERRGAPPRFTMLAPESEGIPHYVLFLEWDAPDEAFAALAARVEAGLAEGFAYDYARRLGQLASVRSERVRDGARRYEARCVALGQRAGDVKPVDLHRATGWRAWFSLHEPGRCDDSTRGIETAVTANTQGGDRP